MAHDVKAIDYDGRVILLCGPELDGYRIRWGCRNHGWQCQETYTSIDQAQRAAKETRQCP